MSSARGRSREKNRSAGVVVPYAYGLSLTCGVSIEKPWLYKCNATKGVDCLEAPNGPDEGWGIRVIINVNVKSSHDISVLWVFSSLHICFYTVCPRCCSSFSDYATFMSAWAGCASCFPVHGSLVPPSSRRLTSPNLNQTPLWLDSIWVHHRRLRHRWLKS